MIFIFIIANIESLHANFAVEQTLFTMFKFMRIVVIKELLIEKLNFFLNLILKFAKFPIKKFEYNY